MLKYASVQEKIMNGKFIHFFHINILKYCELWSFTIYILMLSSCCCCSCSHLQELNIIDVILMVKKHLRNVLYKSVYYRNIVIFHIIHAT